jgi:ferredoxin
MARIVTVDTDGCIGCGTCAELCPTVFKLDEHTGKSSVILPSGGPEDCIDQAIDACPVGVINWED